MPAMPSPFIAGAGMLFFGSSATSFDGEEQARGGVNRRNNTLGMFDRVLPGSGLNP